MKRRLSGIKPTGKLHLGNYFGAIKQFIEQQDDGKNFYFVADYHSLTALPEKKQLEEDSLDIVINYLACGLDPEKATIFLQSSVPEHTELCWILANLTPFGLLNRAHAFKDKMAKGENVNSGLFLYPVLMAADILIYDSTHVPVGKDQKQHVEIARDIALKFNDTYGETFVLPAPEIIEERTVPGIDGRKMSKSYDNTIGIFDNESDIKKKIMSVVTDSKSVEEPKDPDNNNIFAIHNMFLNKEESKALKEKYLKGGIGYGDLKKDLLATTIEYLAPFRAKRGELLGNMDYVEQVLKNGKNSAKSAAMKKLEAVRSAVGLIG